VGADTFAVAVAAAVTAAEAANAAVDTVVFGGDVPDGVAVREGDVLVVDDDLVTAAAMVATGGAGPFGVGMEEGEEEEEDKEMEGADVEDDVACAADAFSVVSVPLPFASDRVILFISGEPFCTVSHRARRACEVDEWARIRAIWSVEQRSIKSTSISLNNFRMSFVSSTMAAFQ